MALGHVPFDQGVQITAHVQSILGGLQKARDVLVRRLGPSDSEGRCSGVQTDESGEARSLIRNILPECTTMDMTKIGDVREVTVSPALIVGVREGTGKLSVLSGEGSTRTRILIAQSTSFWNVRMANSRRILPQAQRYDSSWQCTCPC